MPSIKAAARVGRSLRAFRRFQSRPVLPSELATTTALDSHDPPPFAITVFGGYYSIPMCARVYVYYSSSLTWSTRVLMHDTRSGIRCESLAVRHRGAQRGREDVSPASGNLVSAREILYKTDFRVLRPRDSESRRVLAGLQEDDLRARPGFMRNSSESSLARTEYLYRETLSGVSREAAKRSGPNPREDPARNLISPSKKVW